VPSLRISKVTDFDVISSCGQAVVSNLVLIAAKRCITMAACTGAGLEKCSAMSARLNIGFSRQPLRELPPQATYKNVACDPKDNATHFVGDDVRRAYELT
jgi:hypothetical protein